MKRINNSITVQRILGERLKSARTEKKIKRRELVEMLCGCEKAPQEAGSNSEDYVGKLEERLKQWEYGNNPISLEWIPAICEVLACDVGYLFGEYEEKNRVAADIRKATGLTEDAIYFLQTLKEGGNTRCNDILTAINTLISEQDFDRCSDFWDRLALFLFSSSTPYKAQFGNRIQSLSAEDVLSILLSENEQYLRTLRREKQNNG